jgi:predicted amidohydrolase YtcJ
MCFSCDWASAQPPNRRAFLAGATASAAAFAGIRPQPARAVYAGSVAFVNGAVYTMNSKKPWAEAVVVERGRIAYVGDTAAARSLASNGARVIDLHGQFLMPGFVEAHIHPVVGGYVTAGAQLQFDTRARILAELEAYARANPGAPVIRGFGWRYNAFPDTGPTKEDLDRIWPDTPVILFAIDVHSAWVNSAALRRAKITRETPDPIPNYSYFQRDPKTGDPTGYLVEVPAIVHVVTPAEPPSLSVIGNGLQQWLPKASAAGITSLFDAGIVMVPDTDGFGLYRNLEAAGKLPVRVVGSYYFNNPDVDPIPIITSLRKTFDRGLVRVPILKISADGGDFQRTAAMLAPYADDPQSTGATNLPPETIKRVIVEADRLGIDVHIHAYGDRTIRMCLDAIESAIAANPVRDRRHTLAHSMLIDKADLPRYGKLGVIGQFSTQWIVPDPSWQNVTRARWGARADRMYSLASLLADGARITLGTDWPAAGYHSTYVPLEAIEIATRRAELGKPDAPIMRPVDERITLAQALHANTFAAAYQLRLDHEVGSLEVGKRADLVVMKENPFRVQPHEVHAVPIAMTMMDGRFTHGG